MLIRHSNDRFILRFSTNSSKTIPLIQITSNLALTDAEKSNCLQTLSKAVSELLGKSEDFVMTSWISAKMTMAGTEHPTMLVDLRAIRLAEDAPLRLTAELCERIRLTTDIQADRIYITYRNEPPSNWGWNGKTFG
ncbi:MAG: phenylpyruvate tautomerase MIF-related protein [Opitutae bacterium]|nr:phenylpyruvate tautomerase MIF-related protein [Opitutae bacterium]